jgi:CRISPR/Cas system-associated exonuclease Cas4 (RecB family)
METYEAVRVGPQVVTVELYGGRITLDFNPRTHRYYVGGASPDGVSTIAKAAAPFQGDDWAGRINVREVRDQILAHIEASSGVFPSESELLGICAEAETYHQRVRDAAGDGGSATHDLIEKHLMDQPYEIPDDKKIIAGMKAFLSWKGQTDIEMVECERYIFSEKYFYAGRTDLVGRRAGKLLVGDFKTGSGFYTDQPYQIAGYALAIEEETGDKIEEGLIIHLDKNTGRFKEYPVVLDDDMKGAWKAAVIHYKNLKRIRKMVAEQTNGRR